MEARIRKNGKTWKPRPKNLSSVVEKEIEERGIALAPQYGGALISPDHIRFPWDQQEEETTTEYSLWRLYFDIGPGRSLEKLARTSNRTIEYLHGLAERCDWERRTEAYQNYLDSVVVTVVEKQISTNRVTAKKALGQVISHKIGNLTQKVLSQSDSEDTVEGLLAQLKDLTIIFKNLNNQRDDANADKNRSVNIMFAPVISAGNPTEVIQPETTAEPEVTYEEAEVTHEE